MADDKQPASKQVTRLREALDLSTSVAGEEDPGASLDMAPSQPLSPGRSDQPAGQAAGQPATARGPMSPGSEAPGGTPGTGQNVCPQCGGTGKLAGAACTSCDGTGTVALGIGGA